MKQYMAITGTRDGLGRAPFTIYWKDPDGVYRPEPSKHDGKPVGYRRAQCFKAVPEDYIARGVRLAVTETAAIALAWGDS